MNEWELTPKWLARKTIIEVSGEPLRLRSASIPLENADSWLRIDEQRLAKLLAELGLSRSRVYREILVSPYTGKLLIHWWYRGV